MIRSSTALTVLALALPPVWAQGAGKGGNVTIYGIIDSGVEYARTSGGPAAARSASLVSGSNSASRLGFDVLEDLGGGLYAGARLENGFESDTGATTSAAKYFNRASFVKLGGALGELRFGREYTPAFYVLQQSDINGLNLYGNVGTFTQLGANGFARTDNAINYISPKLANTVIRAAYSMGDERTSPPRDGGRVASVSAVFDNKSWVVGAFFLARRDLLAAGSAASGTTKFMGVAGRWNGPGFSIGAGASRWDPAGPDTATMGVLTSWWLGASYKAGASEFRAQAGRLRRSSPALVQPRATLFGISYLYSLSRRTTLYATYGQMNNNEAAGFRLEASSRQVALPVSGGMDTRAIALGITHRF